jgi:hypothetical protein
VGLSPTFVEPAKHPDFRVLPLRIGREQSPLLVIDNFVAAPDALVELAASKGFAEAATYYPGVRTKAPLTYQRYAIETLRPLVDEYFGLKSARLRFSACYFSLVTKAPAGLTYLQRIPHVDSLFTHELAFIHYLFHGDLGGTAFYRHRATGFESVDTVRSAEYWPHVEAAKSGPNAPPAAYINGDTPLYEEIARQDGVFNRLLLYRRNSLHSGALAADFVPDTDPRKGRLSLNGFLAT